MTQAKRILSDVEVKEISMVGKPATGEKFLFAKQEKLKVEIESDGTGKGSAVTINGEKMSDLKSFNFSFWNVEKDALVDCSYSKVVESEDGFTRTETFYLSKGEKMIAKEIQELLKEYSGKDDYEFVKADLGEDAVKILKGALKLVNTYKADFTDEMKDAVGVLVEYAATATVVEDVKTEKEEKDNKDDKEDVTKDDKGEAVKDEATEEISKSVEALTKKIEELVESSTEVEKALKANSERLDVVEKSTGVKKSIDGQDDDSADANDEFPSLKI